MIIGILFPEDDPFFDWAEKVFKVNDQLIKIVHGDIEAFCNYWDSKNEDLFVCDGSAGDWLDFVDFNEGLE